MREILFRGQTRRYGEKVRMGDGTKVPSHWVYGGVLQGGFYSIIYGGENENDPAMGLDKWCVYTDTLGQFTGLIDKNGRKIFEGDIVRDDYESGALASVVWLLQGCGWYLSYSSTDRRMGHRSRGCSYAQDEFLEVIGNIHDNPELLDGERRTQ